MAQFPVDPDVTSAPTAQEPSLFAPPDPLNGGSRRPVKVFDIDPDFARE